jgi:hypothetical protein
MANTQPHRTVDLPSVLHHHVIPSPPPNDSRHTTPVIPSGVFGARNLLYGFSVDLSGAARVDDSLFGGLALPTVKYLRILSRRFWPRPRTASKSSTLLNGPYDLRICKIFCAVDGPIPGTV